MTAPPPPGRLVSLGTHRLHVHCSGIGSPSVVFDAALGGSSLSWTYVQPAVAAFTTACTYDRAGFGWSDAGPLPRTAGRIADELHMLLTTAALAPPFVLVGHSFGAFSIRAYAARHPKDVAGLVFVDPAHPEEWRDPSPADRERLQRGVTLCRRGVFAAKSGIATLVARLASAGALNLARGIAAVVSRRTLHRQDEEILAPVTKLPMEVRAVLRWMWTEPRYFEALGSQIAHVCASASELDLRPDYGDRPLPRSRHPRSAASARCFRTPWPGARRAAATSRPNAAATGSRSTSRRRSSRPSVTWCWPSGPRLGPAAPRKASRSQGDYSLSPDSLLARKRVQSPENRYLRAGGRFASGRDMSAEALLGRSLAVIAHPHLAWRVLSQRGRIYLAGAYLVVAYAVVLTTLLLARP